MLIHFRAHRWTETILLLMPVISNRRWTVTVTAVTAFLQHFGTLRLCCCYLNSRANPILATRIWKLYPLNQVHTPRYYPWYHNYKTRVIKNGSRINKQTKVLRCEAECIAVPVSKEKPECIKHGRPGFCYFKTWTSRFSNYRKPGRPGFHYFENLDVQVFDNLKTWTSRFSLDVHVFLKIVQSSNIHVLQVPHETTCLLAKYKLLRLLCIARIGNLVDKLS